MLRSIDSYQNRVSADQHHLTISRAQVSTHRGRVFLKLSADKLLVIKCIGNKLCLWAALDLLNFDFKLTKDAKIQPVFTDREGSCFWLFSPWSRSTSNFYALIGQTLKIYAASGNFFTDSWSWQSFVSSCGVFNCIFPLDVQNEIHLLSRLFWYSWLACLLGFRLRIAPLVKVIINPISDSIVFLFHLSWCVRGLKSLKRLLPYLMAFRSCMKSSTVYAASFCTFV